MNYYVVETDKHKLIQKTAGVKARQDVETIFKWNNLKKIEIPCLIEGRENKTRLGKIKAHYDVYMLWKNALKKIKKNDWIYIQFPLLEHTMLFSLLIKNLEKILVVNEGTATIDYVPSRNNSRVAKAPQSFWLDDILKAHEKALSEGEKNCIDSCTMMQRYGYDLYLIDGPGENIKITTPEDFYTMRAILEAKENEQIYGLE